MTKGFNTRLGAIYSPAMPREAGQRLIDVTGLEAAPGISADHVRDGICFIVSILAADMYPPTNSEVRGQTMSARKALAKYSLRESELMAIGFPMPLRPDDWIEEAIKELDIWLKQPKSNRRAGALRTQAYPYLLALYQLTFGKAPTAYYYSREQRDGPTLAFIRQAACEIDTAFSELIVPMGYRAASKFGDGNEGTFFASLPEGDALRSAIEDFLPRDEDIEGCRMQQEDKGAGFDYALRLMEFVLLRRN